MTAFVAVALGVAAYEFGIAWRAAYLAAHHGQHRPRTVHARLTAAHLHPTATLQLRRLG